jgi:hypothetical protein
MSMRPRWRARPACGPFRGLLALLAAAATRPATHGQEPAAVARNMTQTQALLAFKASGGAADGAPLASWRNGTEPCGGAWEGVACSGGAAPAVTGLDLGVYDIHGYHHPEFQGVAGDVGALSPLVQLTYMSLYETEVAGDVKGLAPLVQLTHLRLGRTAVGGRAGSLAPLARLVYLDLYGTAVAGCGAFCAVGGAFSTHCGSRCSYCGCSG